MSIDLRNEDGSPKTGVQTQVKRVLAELFGETPDRMKVPPGSGLPEGGARLARRWYDAAKPDLVHPLGYFKNLPNSERSFVRLDGGYSLYRQHCLHCHGVSGDGMGPTATYLWPRPRDYRRGVYKFTSTNSNKPSREDLRRIILHGVHGTSMPAFEALMSEADIEQVIDYVIFLSARGETELALINEAMSADDADVQSTINAEAGLSIAQTVFESWRQADAPDAALNPPVVRKPSTPESIESGKSLFLGKTKENLQCAGCHGADGAGNGPSFIPLKTFQEIVFKGQGLARYDELLVLERLIEQGGTDQVAADPTKLPAQISGTPGEGMSRMVETSSLVKNLITKKYLTPTETGGVRVTIPADELTDLKKERDLWLASLDDWGTPLRPANLLRGVYKGGRRPLDLYWRIAKGINGAKMPAHASIFPDDPGKMWDVVNFVLALPYQPDLLKGAEAGPLNPAAMVTPASEHSN
jgi:mono/diheme cytochrome c family protein